MSGRWTTDRATSARMARVKRSGTGPELVVRRELVLQGRKCLGPDEVDLPGSPDVAVMYARLAVFVNGCFWHHHQGCAAGRRIPVRNRARWLSKFRTNARRQAWAVRELGKLGWRTLVVWECETKMPAVLRAILRQATKKRGQR